jgi:hypothetical protein
MIVILIWKQVLDWGGGDNYAQKFWGVKVPEYIKSEHVEVLRPPKHGNLFYEAFRKDSKPGSAYGSYKYVPERGYLGIDKVTFKITVDDKVFKVVYVIKVVSQHDVVNDDPSMYCGKNWKWKIL